MNKSLGNSLLPVGSKQGEFLMKIIIFTQQIALENVIYKMSNIFFKL